MESNQKNNKDETKEVKKTTNESTNTPKTDKAESTKETPLEPQEESVEKVIPDEILEAIPEEDRREVSRIINSTMISGIMQRKNPIADKITTEHITQLITKSEEQDKRDREERKGERTYNLILILIALIFIGFLIIFLQSSNEDLLMKIIIAIFSFIGGFGFGRTKNNKTT